MSKQQITGAAELIGALGLCWPYLGKNINHPLRWFEKLVLWYALKRRYLSTPLGYAMCEALKANNYDLK
jgi:hypothetical protein